ncbi:MAG: TonB-dependent receptor [Cytophagales bacterium]|nr:TonB-dependent receptor [Cytophagales bacterium]
MSKKLLLLTLTLTLTLFFSLQAQTQLTGYITDESGQPLPGASVRLINTPKGSISDIDGKYSISNLKVGKYFVEVSFVGFDNMQKEVQLIDQETRADFKLVQAAEQLSEIIVTANRRLQDIQKTAASVSAIKSKQVEQLQVKQLHELNSISPNFRSYDDGGTGSFTLIASRGISTIDFNPIIGLYVDEVPYFTTYAFPLSLSDVEQIEILRGPQGTLYGRNALAGVIKITSKRPSNNLSGYATMGLGNLSSREFGFGMNIPLVEDQLYLRGNVNSSERDGFVRNLFNGKDLQNRQALDANFRLKYYPSDKLSFSLLYNFQQRESDAYAFILSDPPGFTLQDALENSLYQINFNEDVFREVYTENVALNIAYDLGKISLNSVTAFQRNTQDRLDEFDYSPLDFQSAESELDYRNITQEFRLMSTADAPWQWTGGIFLYRNQNENEDILFVGEDNTAENAPYQRLDEIEVIQKGVAVYGQSSYDLTSQLSATAGLRFDYEDVTADVDRTFSTTAIPEGSFSEGADFTAISPKVALSYQAHNNVFLFANVARGYRPGGINIFATNLQDAPFDPENTINYELGLKSNLLKNRFKFNVVGFWINYTDQQVFTILDGPTFNFGTDNIGESRSYGVEVESQWIVSKGLVFNANLGYLDTEILDYSPSTIDEDTFEEIVLDESGNDLPVSPSFNGNVNVNYILPLTPKFNLEASVDYIYQSDMYFDVANNMLQEAYGLLNGRVGVTSKNLDIFVWGKNITDEAYFGYGYGVGGFNATSFGLPRTYGATLTAKF